MKKPKVLFVLHLPPPMHGAAMMGNYLQQSTLINHELDAHYINLATNKILSQSGKGSFKKIFTFASLITNLISVLRRHKFDLCYMTLTASGAGFYKDALIVSIIKRWNKNIIYHFHNKGVASRKNRFTDSLYKFVFRGTKSILLSRSLYGDIRQYVNERDVFYCANGIPDNYVSISEKMGESGPKESRFQLLFLSNMMREKGVFDLLDACREMQQNGKQFTCHFVGGWLNISEEEFRKEIRERKLQDVVFAHGPKYGSEKEAFYRSSQVFVFPTFYNYESFPLVCLEAMQYSMAVVSTTEGGIPDIIVDGETGFLVPQHDAHMLAEKLTVLLEDEALRRSMQQQSRKRFEQLFTLDKWEQNLTQILKTAALKN